MITINKIDFLNAIKAIKLTCGKVNLQPILSTIHLKSENGGLILTSTDINNSARTIIEANITTPIDVCINADKLEAIISKLNDTITLETKDAFLIIKSGKANFELLFLNSEEYPHPNFTLSDDKIILDGNTFIESINKTIFATAQIESQKILTGICITFSKDNLEFASCDGNRLTQIKHCLSVKREGQIVIPRKILLDLIKNVKDKIEIYFKDNKVIFKTENCLFSSTLLNGSYPKYQQLIPKDNNKKVILNRNELINAIERVAIMVNDRTNIVKFNFTKEGQLEIMADTPEAGKSKDILEVTFKDDNNFFIGFNYRYLLDGLKVMTGETVTFEMKNPLNACLIKDNDNQNYLYLIMPIKIN